MKKTKIDKIRDQIGWNVSSKLYPIRTFICFKVHKNIIEFVSIKLESNIDLFLLDINQSIKTSIFY